MALAKRIFLFVAVNVLVMATISILTAVLGIQPYLTARGINYSSLAAFCLLWGFGGAFISLALSRVIAKWSMGVQLISERDLGNPDLRFVYERVAELSRSAGLAKMPQVGFYESPELNAFATGPTRNRALVAVSTGLLYRMNRDQVEGVLAHEVAHISNGDMVTMTLIQGVVNAFVMFIARIIGFVISQNVREEARHTVQFISVIVTEIALSILGSFVVAYFSRLREYRADGEGARLAGRDKMIAALRGLMSNLGMETDEGGSAPALAALKISGKTSGWMALLSTHPPLEDRIRRLEQGVR